MKENNFTKYSQENENNIIPFVDENGNKVEFELVDAFEMQDKEYVALVPAEDVDEEETEVIIMRIEHEDDEDILVYIEDNDELDSAFDIFKDRMCDEFDIIE